MIRLLEYSQLIVRDKFKCLHARNIYNGEEEGIYMGWRRDVLLLLEHGYHLRDVIPSTCQPYPYAHHFIIQQ